MLILLYKKIDLVVRHLAILQVSNSSCESFTNWRTEAIVLI